MTKATVIIPCYNAEDTIRQAVSSVLAQTVPVDVIVVDDCSSDRSFEILTGMAEGEPRLTVLRQAQNGGPSAARNRGLELVKTPWVAGLDADDYLLPERMERLVAQAETLGADLLADDVVRTEPGQAPGDGYRVWRDESVGVVEMDLAEFLRQNILKYCGFRREIGYLKPLMRMEFLRANDLSFREDMRLSEDYDLYARSIAAGGRWIVIDPCGYIAVNQPGSLSKSFPMAALEKVREADLALLAHPKLDADDRSALREHIHLVSTDIAWRRLIESAKARNPGGVLRAFSYGPFVSGKLVLRTAKHFLRIPLYPPDDDAGRKRAGLSAGLGPI